MSVRFFFLQILQPKQVVQADSKHPTFVLKRVKQGLTECFLPLDVRKCASEIFLIATPPPPAISRARYNIRPKEQ